jgi:hypothetical protein
MLCLIFVSMLWIAMVIVQMCHYVHLESVQMNLYLDILILGSTEFLASLFSKVLFKSLPRRTSLSWLYAFIALCMFFMMGFGPEHTQTKYVVTISTRAAL